MKFKFTQGRTVVSIDLDATLLIRRIAYLGTRKVKYSLVNPDLIKLLQQIKRDAGDHPIHFYIFTARNRKETVTYLMAQYAEAIHRGLSHEEAVASLITIGKVIASLEAALGVKVSIATIYDRPGEIGSYAQEVLKDYEYFFIEFLNWYKDKVTPSQQLWDLPEYQNWVKFLKKEVAEDAHIAGKRCHSKAHMLYDIHAEVAAQASTPISTLWFDDSDTVIQSTLKNLRLDEHGSDIASRLVVCHINHSLRGAMHSDVGLLLGDIHHQINVRSIETMPFIDFTALSYPPLDPSFAFVLAAPRPRPISTKAVIERKEAPPLTTKNPLHPKIASVYAPTFPVTTTASRSDMPTSPFDAPTILLPDEYGF